MGTHLWGFDALGGVPDIVTLGKAIGNVLEIRPPLAFSESDAERLADALDRALGALA
jgi:4-aminobutyrate aminotransferase-like enzyme